MSNLKLQIIWELVVHGIAGVLLLCYALCPSFKYLTAFVVCEYVVGVINTIIWVRWVYLVERKAVEK